MHFYLVNYNHLASYVCVQQRDVLCGRKYKINFQIPREIEFPGGSDGKPSVYKAGDPGSIPELRRSPGEGNGNPLQYCCLENPMDGGAWWTIQSMRSQRVGHD